MKENAVSANHVPILSKARSWVVGMMAPPPPDNGGSSPTGSRMSAPTAVQAGNAAKDQPDRSRINRCRLQLLGRLRSLRAEAQNLQNLMLEVKSLSDASSEKLRAGQVKEALQERSEVFDANRVAIETLLAEINSSLEQDDCLVEYDWASDEITKAENYWERAGQYLSGVEQPVGAGNTVDNVLSLIAKASDALDGLIYQCALLTVPPRVNQHLKSLQVGQTLDFKSTFIDELPGENHRKQLLLYMAAHPTSVDGIVDVDRGLIFKASPYPARRVISYLLLIAAALAGAVLAYWMPSLASDLGITLPPKLGARELLSGYLLVLLGGLVHIGIDALKQVRQAQTNGGPSFLAIENWLTWIHVQELYNLATIVWLWIGFLGWVFLVSDPQYVTAFLIGYSIDSFADLFLQRFAKFTTSGVEAVKQQLGASPS